MLAVCTGCVRRLPSARYFVARRWQTTTATHHDITPTILARAKSIADEHGNLAEKLAHDFDSKAAKRLGELTATTAALKEYESARSSLKELQSLLRSPDKELQQLAEEDVQPTQERIEQASNALKSSLLPVHPFAHLPCLVEIRPGAGGDEANIFAGELLRMYEGFCARIGLKSAILKLDTRDDISTSNVAASAGTHIQEAVLEVDTPGAYGVLRCESGVHRVQRVPATEKQGRTHTSAASVLVLPSMSTEGQDSSEIGFDDPKSDYYVDVKDVKTDTMRASGAGGQHVNKTESAIRLTHVPTGTVVAVQESRSQMRNREKAWQLLRSRIAQQRREQREEEEARMRKRAGAGKAGRENKVRTYNFGQQRVSDHRSSFDSRNLSDVMDGGEALDKVMESVRVFMAEQDMLDLVAEAESKER